MTVTRRDFLAGAGALSALAAVPRSVVASVRLGEATLTTVTDGSLVLPGSFVFAPMPEAELARVLAGFGVSADRLEPECNVALYRDGTSTVLFDAGAGPDFMPSAGVLIDSLHAVGVAPDEVTHVVFTHAHPDHIWGLIDEFDELVFSEATYMMGRVEWDYWWDPGTVNTIGEARAAFAVGAARPMAFSRPAIFASRMNTDNPVTDQGGNRSRSGLSAARQHPGKRALEVAFVHADDGLSPPRV